MSEATASYSQEPAHTGRHDLVQILLETTELTEEQLEAARERRAETGERLLRRPGGHGRRHLRRGDGRPLPASSTCPCARTSAPRWSTRRWSSACRSASASTTWCCPSSATRMAPCASLCPNPHALAPHRRPAHALRGRRDPPRAGEPAHDPGRDQRGLRPRNLRSTDALAEDAAGRPRPPGRRDRPRAGRPARRFGRRCRSSSS